MIESVEAATRVAYEDLRKKLIDTTLRNRMINYKVPIARSAVGLEITQESSSEVWNSLVLARKKFSFTGPPDPSKKQDQLLTGDHNAPLEELAGSATGNDKTDLVLYSPTPKTKRESRLLGTWRSAVEQLEERGVNTLFLALGMLEWKDPNEELTHRAPLILIPVTLERTPKGDFRLIYEEEDISTNESLRVKLAEFRIELPEMPADLEGFQPSSYFDLVSDTVRNHDGWHVHVDEIALNFFSFEKIALFLDLDTQKWPDGLNPLNDEDVSAALGRGYKGGESPFTDETQIDDLRSATDSREVFPADSSQLLVIMEACRGTSMVVEGPPGTGKSQTIANLVAELVSHGKKVLFVSEKMAALDVVYRRLEEAGLAEAALKLHGQKANRRSFFESIKNTWFRQSKLNEATQRLERLSELRRDLNQYVRDLHAPLSPYQISPRRLMSVACGLPPVTDEDLDSKYDPTALAGSTFLDMERLRETFRVIQQKTKQIGIPSAHCFWGSALEFIGPDERILAERTITRTIANLDSLIEERNILADTLGIERPDTLQDISMLNRCVEIALEAPPLDGVAVKLGSWHQDETRVRSAIKDITRYQELRKQNEQRLLPLAWDQDWATTRLALERKADSFYGRLSGEFRRAAAHIQNYLKDSAKPTPGHLKDLSRDLFEAQSLRSSLFDFEQTGAKLFGVQWQGWQTDPSRMDSLLNWVLRIETDIDAGRLPNALLQFFNGDINAAGLKDHSKLLAEFEKSTRSGLSEISNLLKIALTQMESKTLADMTLTLRRWLESLGQLSEIIGWNLIVKDAQGKNLAPVLELAAHWPLASERLESHVLRHWANSGIKQAFEERPSLARFERQRHEEMITEFQRLDELIMQHNRSRVAHAHLRGLPQAGSVGLTAELFRQCELKRGHKSIRWAFERFGELILKIKPICMMSPLSVATFLPRQLEFFDIVIFDEASQVKPEDALSAMARAKSIVVVGDSKQMPPTSFFDTLANDDGDGEELEYDAAIGKMESVLALCSAAVQNSYRRRDLRWHYRSLHQALIQPSNRLFYEDRLVVFPSPVYATTEAKSELGLRFRYDPNAVYDRGATRKINVAQAEQVARAAIAHMKEQPQNSLMAVAFSKDQQQAIQDAFDRLRQGDPGLMTEYDALHPFERFTVKNLETVQGDERDVVYISVGYGRDVTGALTMNFGPINKESGGRRLNVLMSRSRKRIEVFSSIRSADIVVSEQRETGLNALKIFLEFAETGFLQEQLATGQEEDSDFEIQVRQAIEQHGFKVDPQVGTAGFRIDLAVRHPKKPGLYVLGIECDGATYHSARSARDRDKLRQIVLEQRGWRLHRIWSSDWWSDREASLKRALSAINQAIEMSDEDESLAAKTFSQPAPEIESIDSIELWNKTPVLKAATGAQYRVWDRPFQLSGMELHEIPSEVMARCVATVTAFEGPIHEELLTKRIRESAGKGRAGQRIAEAIKRGISLAKTLKQVRHDGNFLYWPEAPEIRARNRSDLPSSEKRIDWVSPEEIDDAILSTVKVALEVNVLELNEAVRKVFGFARTPDALPMMILARIEALTALKKIRFDGQTLSPTQ